LGRYDEALDEYQKAVKLRPNFVDILTQIGMTLREKGELDRAIEAFSKAKEASVKYVPAYIHLGIAYYTQNRRDLALQEWKAAQKIDPANRAVQVYLNLAKKP
jgi:tetratricopeptide (TPR) repeat protein